MSIGKRERRSTEFFEDNTTAPSGGAGGDLKARFDLTVGKGTPLSQFPGWVPTTNRGSKKEAEALEDALEPLHRALFGRPGKSGERRQALAEYRGFPETQRPIFKAKVTTWKKDQLKDLVQALGGTGILVSVPLATLGEDVLKFLEAPHVAKAAATPSTPKPKVVAAAKTERAPESKSDAPVAKKARAEPATTAVPKKPVTSTATPPVVAAKKQQPSSGKPTIDTVRVEVYRRVLNMSVEERSNLSVKGLRQAIGEFLKIDEATMKSYTDALKETAAECVKALKAAEARGESAEPTAAVGGEEKEAAVAAEENNVEGEAPEDDATNNVAAVDNGASPQVALLDEEEQ